VAIRRLAGPCSLLPPSYQHSCRAGGAYLPALQSGGFPWGTSVDCTSSQVVGQRRDAQILDIVAIFRSSTSWHGAQPRMYLGIPWKDIHPWAQPQRFWLDWYRVGRGVVVLNSPRVIVRSQKLENLWPSVSLLIGLSALSQGYASNIVSLLEMQNLCLPLTC
jgi:hypothetical protein